jgi:hypothetical protein
MYVIGENNNLFSEVNFHLKSAGVGVVRPLPKLALGVA